MDTANKNINIKTPQGEVQMPRSGFEMCMQASVGSLKWGVKFVNIISRAFQFSKKYL